MRKNVDMEQIAREVAEKMAGKARQYTMAPGTLDPYKVVADVDVATTINKQASDMLSSSQKLDGLDHTVKGLEENHSAIMKALNEDTKSKLASLKEVVVKVAVDARSRGLIAIAERLENVAKGL